MTTSSADPGALGHYASSLTARAAELDAAVTAAVRALSAYAAACPEVPVDQRLALTAPMRLQRARSLANDVRLIMEAFMNADRGMGPPARGPAQVGDYQLSLHLARHAPGLATGDLLAPIRARTTEGAEAGRELADSLREGRDGSIHRSAAVLEALHPADVRDPAFAAGFLNQLDAETLELLTAGILRHRYGPPDDLPVAVRNLQLLLRSAGHTHAGHFAGEPLRSDLLADLLAGSTGRQTLRFLLFAGPDSPPPPPELVRQLQHDLLVDSSAALDSRSPFCEVSRYTDRHGLDLDAAALRPIAGDLSLVNDLLADPDAIAVIRGQAEPSAYPDLALVVAHRIDHLVDTARSRIADHEGGSVSNGSGRVTARADATIRRYVATLAADPGGATTEELVLIADSIRFHMGYYLDPGPESRSDGAGPREQVDALLPAFAEDRAALVVLLAAVEDWEREVLDRHFGADPNDTSAQIAHIDHFQARLHDAAVAADVPDDDWALLVSVSRGLVDHGASALAVKTKGLSLLAGRGAHRGLDRIHEELKGDPGDHASLAATQETRRRINAWCAIARSHRGSELTWGSLPGVDVADLAELAALDPGDPDDHERLRRWAEQQPGHLHTSVEEVVGT